MKVFNDVHVVGHLDENNHCTQLRSETSSKTETCANQHALFRLGIVSLLETLVVTISFQNFRQNQHQQFHHCDTTIMNKQSGATRESALRAVRGTNV